MREGGNERMSDTFPSPFHKGEGQGGGFPSFSPSLLASKPPVSHEMPAYGVNDVERVLQMSRGTIRSLIKAGFVSPARGPRREYLFSFQDLIVLRTARALNAAKVPPRRITLSLKQLREHLPEQIPLSGLSIRAVGNRVVVQDGSHRWQA